MRLLVTGGAGFIGSHFVAQALQGDFTRASSVAESQGRVNPVASRGRVNSAVADRGRDNPAVADRGRAEMSSAMGNVQTSSKINNAPMRGQGFKNVDLVQNADLQVTVLDAMTYASSQETVEKLAKTFPDRCEVVVGSVLDKQLCHDLVTAHDVVVHFAAESHNDNSLRDPSLFVQTNVLGTLNLLEAVRSSGAHFHHVSTDEVYGDLPLGGGKFDEESPYRPSSPYSASKASADHLVRGWVRSFGISATISNCSNNYGPRQHVEKLIPRTITERLEGRRPRLYGTGVHVRDWIHVHDHNHGLWQVITRGKQGQTYLIGANQEFSNLEVVAMINELMGFATDDVDFVADRPGHDLRYALDASKIRGELGWQPEHRDFRAGLAQTIQWYIENRAWWEPQKAATEARLLKWGL